MTYRTVFEITRQSYDWWFVALGAVVALLGFVVVYRNRKGDLVTTWNRQWKYHLMVWFGLVWTIALFAGTFPEHYNFHRAYRSGSYSVVEGVVENFQPMPATEHSVECFSVGSNRFCYAHTLLSNGFNVTAAQGGPIREGLPVRISYANGRILKLEISEPQSSHATTP